MRRAALLCLVSLLLLVLPAAPVAAGPAPVLLDVRVDDVDVAPGDERTVHMAWDAERLDRVNIFFRDAEGHRIDASDCDLADPANVTCRLWVHDGVPGGDYPLQYVRATADGEDWTVSGAALPDVVLHVASQDADRSPPQVLEGRMFPTTLAPGEAGWIGLRFHEPSGLNGVHVTIGAREGRAALDVSCPVTDRDWVLCSVEVPEGVAGGRYVWSGVSATDALGHWSNMKPSDWPTLFPDGWVLDVDADGGDDDAPTLEALRMPTTLYVGEPALARLTVTDATGVADVSGYLERAEGDAYFTGCVRLGGPDEVVCGVVVDEQRADPVGWYRFQSVHLSDVLGNYVSYTPAASALVPSGVDVAAGRMTGVLRSVDVAAGSDEDPYLRVGLTGGREVTLHALNTSTEREVVFTCTEPWAWGDGRHDCRAVLGDVPSGVYYLNRLVVDGVEHQQPFERYPVLVVGEPLDEQAAGAYRVHPRPDWFDGDEWSAEKKVRAVQWANQTAYDGPGVLGPDGQPLGPGGVGGTDGVDAGKDSPGFAATSVLVLLALASRRRR